MAGEYSLNLTNGNLLTNIYPLETDGPDGMSAFRQVLEIKPTYPIVQIGGSDTFIISGNWVNRFPIGTPFNVVGGPNIGSYVAFIASVWSGLPANETYVTVATTLPSNSAGGAIELNAMILNGDLLRLTQPISERRFVAASVFNYFNQHSPLDPRILQTPFVVSRSYLANNTTIVIPTILITTSALPPGEITYPIPANTSLKLSGRGTINYGETLNENLVHLTENFAGSTPPSGNPLIGQVWYRITPTSKTMMIWDGTTWNSDISVSEGSLTFNDPQNPGINPLIILKGDDNDVGLSIKPSVNPPATNSILRVVDSAGTLELLRVEYNGVVKTSNNLEVKGLGDSLIYGRLGIGANGIPTLVRTLSVEGNGINIKSDIGFDAGLVIDTTDPIGIALQEFKISGVLEGNIRVNGNIAGHPLELNSRTNRNINLVTGGGAVGIGIGTPMVGMKLDVAGQVKIDGQLDMYTNKIVNVIDPTLLQDVSTKNYVDTRDNLKVDKSGDIMSGLLTLSGAPTIALHAATKSYVDGISSASSNGYQISPGGMITQWGSGVTITGYLDQVNFPIPFPTAIFSIIVNESNARSWGTGIPNTTTYGSTSNDLSSFLVSAVRSNGGSSNSYVIAAYNWIAIGN